MNKIKFAKYVKGFDFKGLFIDLGWNNYSGQLPVTVDENTFEIQGIVEKRGFVIVLCPPSANGNIPLSKTRKKIEHVFSRFHQEHLIIYGDAAKTKQVWQFVVQEPDKPRKAREIQYSKEQDPEILYQRARGLLFTLDEEENITLVDVIARFKENFAQNTEQVTKKFYTEFKKHHNAFLDFISGIDDTIADKENKNKQWYSSLMLNRLMFCYFIQKRGYLDNNIHYLHDKLKEVKSKAGKNKFYSFYRDFLLELFHKGLGQPEKKRKLSVALGNIPYLDGGLFDVHELERQFDKIQIKDAAFEKIFNFFDQWNWHLDTRVEASGKDINPDVIGYIFEKYINDRAAMGAYYTKEDITDYIGKNTIIPFLFDKVKKEYPKAFKADGFIWSFLKASGDTYIYDAVKKGVPQDEDGHGDLFDDLPEEIKAGFLPELEKKVVKDSSAKHLWEIRKLWNKKAPEEIALPTEIYREVIERRKRYAEVKFKIENGKITEINDFITYNLNIRQFAQDVMENSDDPNFIRHFFKAIKSVTILDPTCGSGAFLFAALNILEPLYETCIERMEQFTAEEPRKYKFFHEVLAEVNSEEHPNLGYYIYKTIILNNLYGVDIMNEAVEIAKLRLFLKMVGAVDINIRKPNYGLEPLPDVDFNIRAGNTLVGFASEDDFRNAVHEKEPLFAKEIIPKFEDEFVITAKAFKNFQDSQLIMDSGEDTHKKAKVELQKRLDRLNEKLNKYLASTYGIDKERQEKKYTEWLESHQPFHWLAEFYEIINGNGGFDVVIGNPPYVQYSKNKFSYHIEEKLYNTFKSGNLYSFIHERSQQLEHDYSWCGMIVQISCLSTPTMESMCQHMLVDNNKLFVSNYATRPAYLFEGVTMNLTVILNQKKTGSSPEIYATNYLRWISDTRQQLFQNIPYSSLQEENLYYLYAIPKLTAFHENRLMSKILSNNTTIGNYLESSKRKTKEEMHYRTAGGRYFKIFIDCDFGTESKSNKSKCFTSGTSVYEFISILSSNTWWWWYTLHFDMYNCKDYMMYNFPYKYSNHKALSDLGSTLCKNLIDNAERKVQSYETTGNREQMLFSPANSKSIIDQIDTILAQHYGFTEEELDFIINYDIKYRMGKELDAYIEGALGKENIKNRE